MSRQVSCQYGKSNIIVIGQKIKEQCHTAAAGCGQLAKPVNITFVNINLRNSGETYWSKQTTAMELKISEPSRLHTSHNQSRESSQCNGLRSKGGGEGGGKGGRGCDDPSGVLILSIIWYSQLFQVEPSYGVSYTEYRVFLTWNSKNILLSITYSEQQKTNILLHI